MPNAIESVFPGTALIWCSENEEELVLTVIYINST